MISRRTSFFMGFGLYWSDLAQVTEKMNAILGFYRSLSLLVRGLVKELTSTDEGWQLRHNKLSSMLFEKMGLSPQILKGIEELGFETATPIQEKVIPYLLEKKHDLIGLAQTGTGKTAAFGLPALQTLKPEAVTPQLLVLSPTRELCMQITRDLENYGKYIEGLRVVAVYGGADIA